jgi:hypothetical protein
MQGAPRNLEMRNRELVQHWYLLPLGNGRAVYGPDDSRRVAESLLRFG